MQHPTTLVAASPRASSSAAERPEALACENVSRWFGGLQAVKSVSVRVGQGEIFCLVGPNGSGKTTLVNAITGFYPPQEGAIRLHGTRIDGTRPHKVARLGVACTFQNVALFRGMSVLDNILMGDVARRHPQAAHLRLVAPGSLPRDGKAIADERRYD